MDELTNADAIHEWSQYPTELIEQFGDDGDLIRRHLLNPALFELLGDVTNKTILDAGCGQGYLARLLARKGARVTGVEPAETMYRYAQQREQDELLGIHYMQEDLSTLSSLTSSFDVVVANMVLMDIPDYISALRNCIAALKEHGLLLISLLHPCFEESGAAWQQKGCVTIQDYFEERAVKQTYGYFIHRPLSYYLNSLIQEGCTLQQILEPRLDQTIAEQQQAERYWHVPGYIIIAAHKLPLRQQY